MALQPAPDERIDRQTTPPFHLNMYYRRNAFHSPAEFHTVPPSASLTRSSLIIYTWSDAKLSELTDLLLSALLAADAQSEKSESEKESILPRPLAGTRIGFRLIFPDTRSINHSDSRGRWLSKPVGSVVIGSEPSGGDGTQADVKMEGDAMKTLADARFVIGDYVSVAIIPPMDDGSVAPMPPAERGTETGRLGPPPRRFGGPPGGGFGYRGDRGDRGDRDRRNGRGMGANVPVGDWQRGERIPGGRDRTY